MTKNSEMITFLIMVIPISTNLKPTGSDSYQVLHEKLALLLQKQNGYGKISSFHSNSDDGAKQTSHSYS